MHTFKFALGLAILTGLSSTCSAGTLFTFENIAANTPVPFTDTVGGLTATFSGEGGVCDISLFNFTLQSGNALITDFCVPSGVSPIAVAFSSTLSSVSMNFAVAGDVPLTLTAFLGATEVGTTTATGTALSSLPEGTIGFSGAPFDNFMLDSSFAISVDNIDATTVPGIVPEPGTMSLMAFAALGLVGFARRRR